MRASAGTEASRILLQRAALYQRHPRQIRDLVSAEAMDLGPFSSSPRVRAKGAKLEGLRYERRFGRFLAQHGYARGRELRSGQWFRFEDALGVGWAQTDHLLFLPGALLVFECKLT